MTIMNFLIEYKEIFKIVYSLLAIFISLLIVVRAHRYFKLSLHQGLRYFRNAFLFYALAFFIRYIAHYTLGTQITSLAFEFFVVSAGFFLLYSLIWKKMEKGGHHSSLFNLKISLFYAMALLIVLVDYSVGKFYLLFVSQIIVFIITSIFAFNNYKINSMKTFPKFNFLAMLLGLVAWTLNGLAVLFFSGNLGLIIDVYVINLVFFTLFLYGIKKSARS